MATSRALSSGRGLLLGAALEQIVSAALERSSVREETLGCCVSSFEISYFTCQLARWKIAQIELREYFIKY